MRILRHISRHISRFNPKISPQINPLSLRLMMVVVGLFAMGGGAVLLASLPGFHRAEMESRMRELAYLAELNAMEIALGEIDLGRTAPPIKPGYGVRLTEASGAEHWLGDAAAYGAVIDTYPHIRVRIWRGALIPQAQMAMAALLGFDDGYSFYQVDAVRLDQNGGHPRISALGGLLMVFPPHAMTEALRGYMLRGLMLVLVLAMIIGVPFAVIIEWLVIFPLRRMVSDMTDFARDPYHQGRKRGTLTHRNIISEALEAFDTMTAATRNELVQRDKLAALGEAVAKINHDMRNVLSVAVLLSDTLERSDDPKVARAGPIVSQAIQRAVELCSHMLVYLKQPGAMTPQPVAMDALIEECQNGAGISIIYTGPKHLVVDEAGFFRLLHNLIGNATAAGANRVEVAVWRAGSHAVVDIADNGPGMEKPCRAQLFKPFAGSTRGSSGLGLAIARDIALAHGGDLRLSRSNANGSEFRLRLPAHVLGIEYRRRWWQ